MKVRIAVATNTNGGWAAVGMFGEPDAAMQSAATEVVSDEGTIPTTLYWVEVELPDVAHVPVVQGTVAP